MFGATDMSTPVTRGELRAELEQFERRLEQKFEQFEQKLEEKLEQKLEEKLEQKLDEKLEQKLDEKLESRFAHLATKKELEIWGGALLARIDAGERRMDALEQRVIAEIARHTKAFAESMSTLVSAVDDKYADLPPRVKRLENRAFRRKRS